MKNVEHDLIIQEQRMATLRRNKNVYTDKTEYLKQWLNSLPKLLSHYCMRETSKLYLEQFFQSKQMLYREYKKFSEKEMKTELIVSNPVSCNNNLMIARTSRNFATKIKIN